ncbi:flagellar motor protein MotB [Oscillospiraceae bacterium 50-58]
MASIKKKGGGGGGGANWMDTYGDMVTLLLCFFVLLYSISTIEQDKWMIFVKSFNRDAVEDISEPQGPVGSADSTGGSGMPVPDDNNEVDEALDQLYDFLVEYQKSSAAAAESMSVSKGDNFVFISFDDAVFFDGNSSYLRPDGKAVLDTIIPALAQAGPMIDELTVLGHTAQQYANEPNKNVSFDRHLASDRATEVVIYIQESISREILYPGRIVVKSFGQWRNIAPNDTGENRAKNRRVELIISGRDLENEMNSDFSKYYAMYSDVTEDDVINYTTNGN